MEIVWSRGSPQRVSGPPGSPGTTLWKFLHYCDHSFIHLCLHLVSEDKENIFFIFVFQAPYTVPGKKLIPNKYLMNQRNINNLLALGESKRK